MTVTDHDVLRRRRRALQLRVDDLAREIEQSDTAEVVADRVQSLVDELQASLAELAVAEEELRAQSEELTSSYGLVVAERERYRRLFEHAPVGHVVTDGEGRIETCNHAAATLLGAARSALVDTLFVSKVAVHDRSAVRDVLSRLRPGAHAAGVVRLRERDGPVHLTVLATTTEREPEILWILAPVAEAAGSSRSPTRDPTIAVQPPPGRTDPPSRVLLLPAATRPFTRADGLRTSGFELLLQPVEARATEPVRAVIETRPDVVVIDVADEDDVDTVRHLDAAFPPLRIVATIADHELVMATVEAGADAVVDRADSDGTLAVTVLAAARDLRIVPQTLIAMLQRQVHHALMLRRLDEDDLQLLRLLVRGRSAEGVAEELHTSIRTVKRRISALRRQLGVGNRAELIAIAGAAALGPDPEETA